MEITIDIIDRTYYQIKEMCEFNNITVEDYVVTCVEDAFNIMKYGDLNKKLNKEIEKPQEVKQETVVNTVIEEKPQEKIPKKRGRPKKVVTEEPQTTVVEVKKEVVPQPIITKEPIEQNNTIITKKRTLKVK